RIVSVDMENLLSIGEFASASRLSQKALRLYGENGLLAPAWVDPESGYRYYGLEQLRSATLIAFLRRSGMPLAEIRSFLARANRRAPRRLRAAPHRRLRRAAASSPPRETHPEGGAHVRRPHEAGRPAAVRQPDEARS